MAGEVGLEQEASGQRQRVKCCCKLQPARQRPPGTPGPTSLIWLETLTGGLAVGSACSCSLPFVLSLALLCSLGPAWSLVVAAAIDQPLKSAMINLTLPRLALLRDFAQTQPGRFCHKTCCGTCQQFSLTRRRLSCLRADARWERKQSITSSGNRVH